MSGGQVLRFLIIDDHPLFREALQSAVELAWPDSATVETASLNEAVAVLEADPSFDLALLDLNLPGVRGIDGLMLLRARFPRLPVVVVSGHEDTAIVRRVAALGASGFVPKSTRKAELADAIRRVLNGEVVPPAGHAVNDDDAERREKSTLLQRFATLTPQQFRVLGMLRDGKLNKQIAWELQVGETTVKAHVSEILRKLGVASRTQAVIEASKLSGADLGSLESGLESG